MHGGTTVEQTRSKENRRTEVIETFVEWTETQSEPALTNLQTSMFLIGTIDVFELMSDSPTVVVHRRVTGQPFVVEMTN